MPRPIRLWLQAAHYPLSSEDINRIWLSGASIDDIKRTIRNSVIDLHEQMKQVPAAKRLTCDERRLTSVFDKRMGQPGIVRRNR